MKFLFKKRIDTTKNSIFYSLITFNNEIIGFGKRDYRERIIKKITLNEDFDIIEDNNILYRAEDPRCFEYKNKLYILDNYFNDMYLIDYLNNNYINIGIISGKNISFINHNNELYFIHFLKPFKLYKFDIENINITKIEVDDDNNPFNYEYRGGTPGYKINDHLYYGFGHRTYLNNDIMTHDVFLWLVDFLNEKPTIKIIAIEQPTNSKNICDPTSVIVLGNKTYLVTAESDKPWFCEQDYITNIYEIIDE